MPILDLFDRVLKGAALIVGGASLAFMMFFGSFNVLIMRKGFNSPIIGAEDLLILSMVLIAAISIPFGGRVGAHIEIEVLERYFPRWFDLGAQIVLRSVAAGLMAVMSWQLVEAGHNADRFGETTQQLLISFGPFYYILAGCVGLYVIVLLSDIVQLVRRGKIVQIPLGRDAPADH